MESGRFAGFPKNALFGNPGILRGFGCLNPPLFMTPPFDRVESRFGDYMGVDRQVPVRQIEIFLIGRESAGKIYFCFFRVPGIFKDSSTVFPGRESETLQEIGKAFQPFYSMIP